MEKRKVTTSIIALFLLLMAGQNGFAMQKVLVIVDSAAFYGYIGQWVLNYVNDITAYDHKNAQYIIWGPQTGTNYRQCQPLWTRLQGEYSIAKNNGDNLEGAVLIGNIPVPQIAPATGYLPLDQVYMDIVDASGNPYLTSPFTLDPNNNGYYTTNYNYAVGDQHYDIWISRIDAAYLDGLRQGQNNYDEYVIYANYLNRVHNRMTMPATVPSRGFAMGPPSDLGNTLHAGLGQYFQLLNLPWLAEFTGGENSSFNWMSQLLAGPRGCINWGAFNGTLFPDERNRRYCRYTQLNTVYVPGNSNPTQQSVGLADSLGWEWAGVYGHSDPTHTNFFSNEEHGININGQFCFGTFGPFWGSNYYINGSGYNGGYYRYQDTVLSFYPPYNYGFGWKGKDAEWRWPVTATSTKTYSVYLYYEAPDAPALNTNNCSSVDGSIYQVTLGSGGLPLSVSDSFNYNVNQQTHINHPLTEHRWELLKSNITLNAVEMAIVTLKANDGRSGNHLADAVRFISSDGTTDKTVDDGEPSSYPDVDNNPSGIFSMKGFIRTDQVIRGYEDMGDEPGGGGFSKTQFFLMKACDINNWIHLCIDPNAIDKNIGNLYSLGHNGLICMGAASADFPGDNKSPFANAIVFGKDFGEAFLDQQNYEFLSPIFSLLGTGTLYARPYIQCGSDIEQYRTISATETIGLNVPILIQNINVASSGTWHVNSTHNSSSSPGTHSEIVIRPECDFAPTGTNIVDFVAN